MSKGKRDRKTAFSTSSSDDSFSFVTKRTNILPHRTDSDPETLSDSSANTSHKNQTAVKMDAQMRSDMKAMFGDFKNEILSSLDEKYGEKIESLEKKTKELEQENHKLKEIAAKQEAKLVEIEELATNAKRHAVQNEQYARRCNVRVLGVAEQRGENCKTVIYNIIREKLSHPIDEMDIVEANRVGPSRPEKPRGIIVRFSSLAVKKAVLPKRRVLKGTGVVFVEDLCRDQQLTLHRVRNDPRVKVTWASDGKIFATLSSRPEIKFRILHGQSVSEAWDKC